MNKHSELIKQYAEDWCETDEPWLRWQGKGCITNDKWKNMANHPSWVDEYEYQRKPQVININGYEVPIAEKKPLLYQTRYYYPVIENTEMFSGSLWTDDPIDIYRLENGLVHLTKENAILHTKALLSFTNLSVTDFFEGKDASSQ